MRTIMLSILLVACSGASSTPPAASSAGGSADASAKADARADDPSDDATADEGATPMAPAEPGLVSEEAFKAAHTLEEDGAYALQGSTVELPGGSKAYLSLPEGAAGPVPGVVVIHEWWGLNDHVKHWADRLADEGYAALAVDLYDGQVATTRDQAMGLMKGVEQEAALKVLHEGHAYLQGAEAVKAPRTASVGWCFGGGWSLQMAIHEPDLDGAVIYYGRLVDDPDKLGQIQAPILGHFATQDQGIPKEAVQGFHDALKAQGKPVTVHMYDAHHAFANPSGERYDEEDAEKAWSFTREFLRAQLKR